jgi:hypothetical protein
MLPRNKNLWRYGVPAVWTFDHQEELAWLISMKDAAANFFIYNHRTF